MAGGERNDGPDYDVVIVGGGGSGLAAGMEAAEAGARVLVVDAADHVGGSAALSGGVLYAAGTRIQRSLGVEDDTPEAMFRYYMMINRFKLQPALVWRLCEEAAGALDWLMALGVSFPAKNLYAAGNDGVLRGHRAEGRGSGIIDVLDQRLSGMANVDIVLRTRIQDLAVTAQGRLAGVVVEDEVISAHAVVLTTGGFGANRELLSQHYPDVAQYGNWVRTIGCPHHLGDGLLMGQRLGADTVGHNWGSVLLTTAYSKDFEPYTPGWLTLIDRTGRRFVDETMDYTVIPHLTRLLPGGECFALFDENARRAAVANLPSKDAKKVVPVANWTADMLELYARKGDITSAGSLRELAEKMSISPENLEATAERINRDCAAGRDSQHFKPPEWLRPLRRPPFYATALRPAVVGNTHTGLSVDVETRVLAETGHPIAGLFAAGEAAGGVLGERYVGGGNSLSNAFTYGRIAGRSAANHARARAKA